MIGCGTNLTGCAPKMTRIVGHLSVFNSAQFISALLISLHKLLDELIIVDGAWRAFLALGYFDKAYSTDGTKEIVEALNLKCPWKWIPAPKTGWESHAEKCAEFLKYLKSNDWQYYLNEDEIPIGDIKKAFNIIRNLKEETTVQVPFSEVSFDHVRETWIFRFFKWQKGIHYGYTHADLMNGKGVNFRVWNLARVSDMQIVHLKEFRVPHMRDRTSKLFNQFTDVHVRGSKKTLEKFLNKKS